METLRRQIHPETRVIDAKTGLVEYNASDETIDSYREVIRAKGWRFNLFKKNAPFADSHSYDTIGKLLGKVVEFRVDTRKGQLINRVQWAIDVPENTLAQLGWKMTMNGYLKAVSVGFFAIKTLTASGANRQEWLKQLDELGLDEKTAPRVIYTEQEQIELSAVIIGANSNALLAAHKAGAINDRDVETIQKSGGPQIFQIPFATKPEPSTDMKTRLTNILDRLNGGSSDDSQAKSPARGGSVLQLPSPAQRGLPLGLYDAAPTLRSLCEAALQQNPELRTWVRSLAKRLCGTSHHFTDDTERAVQRQFRAGTLPGGVVMEEGVADIVLNLMSLYGAWRTLGVVLLDTGKTKLAQVTGEADAQWILPANQGEEITADASIAGTSKDTDCPTLAALVDVSSELMQDGRTTFEGALLEAIANGLNRRLDFACFMADGDADATDGSQTGIFSHADVPDFNAAAGNVSIVTLDFEDFANTIGSVSPSALVRPCRWWANPIFLPKLMLLKDGDEKILKPPTAADGDWMLAGFPVTWVNTAPSTDGASQPIAAFGRQAAFTLALRREFELRSSSTGRGFANGLVSFRALTRAEAKMRDAASFAILNTAAA